MIRESFNQGWYVSKENQPGAPTPLGPVTLPYDAMFYEARDPATPNSHHTGFSPGGVYRYSKSFNAPEDWRGQSVSVEFEGVYMRSEVFLNGHLVGGRVRVIPDGVRFSTKSVEGGTAVVQVATSIINDSAEHRDVTLTASVSSPSQVITTPTDKRLWIEPGETALVVQQV